MDLPEDNSVTKTCQFSSLPTNYFEEDNEYEMIYTSGANLWDFWLAEVKYAKSLEWWKKRITNKVLSNELKEMEVAKSDDLAIVLLPSGFAVRAKILADTTRDEYGAYNASILDVDTGEMMTTYVENLFIPDEELMGKKPMAVNCCLNIGHNSCNQIFLQNVRKELLKVSFKRVTLSTPPKFVVDVCIKGKDIYINLVDILNADGTIQKPNVTMDSRKPTAGDECEGELFKYQDCQLGKKTENSEEAEVITDIQVSHVDSISRFYVWESMDCVRQLNSLMVELKAFYKSTKMKVPNEFLNSITSKYACAVLDMEDLNWYRAEVLSHTKTTDFKDLVQKHYEVLLVDFGSRIEVPSSLIRPLDSQFFKVPVFAKCCHLFGVKPASELASPDGLDYGKDVIEIFDMFLDSGKLTLVEASTSPYDPPDSIPVILERRYKGSDYVINLELLAQKLVSSTVFDMNVCNKILEYANEKKSQQLNMDVKSPTGHKTLEREVEPSKNESIGQKALEREVEYRKEESIGDKVISILSEPAQSYSLENAFNEWNPMEEDYYQSEITYDSVINDDASALIGYQAKDEGRICKFFARSGHCYKGVACRKEHSYIRPDGWTTDSQLVYGNTFSYLSLPESGSEIKLHIMFVADVCKFYSVIVDAWRYKESACEYLPNEKWEEDSLENLIALINSKKNVVSLRRLVMPPGVGEIVLCKLQSVNLYYRGQVLDTNLEDNEFQVLYVDIGISEWVNVRNIRQIEKHHLHLPFQAVDCELAYYGAPDDIDGERKIEIMKKLSSMISFKKLTARVIRSFTSINRLNVELFDDFGANVGEVLKKDGYLVEVPDLYADKKGPMPG